MIENVLKEWWERAMRIEKSCRWGYGGHLQMQCSKPMLLLMLMPMLMPMLIPMLMLMLLMLELLKSLQRHPTETVKPDL